MLLNTSYVSTRFGAISGWFVSRPVSATHAVTPLPVLPAACASTVCVVTRPYSPLLMLGTSCEVGNVPDSDSGVRTPSVST